jgi:hypothetical protein
MCNQISQLSKPAKGQKLGALHAYQLAIPAPNPR